MAIYRNVSMNFWTDSKVDDEFTPEEKYFMLYLLTNPHTNILGCYEISMKQMERETGYNIDTINRLLRRMQDTHGVIRYDATTKEILIVHWHKYNWQKSDKVLKALVDAAAYIKSESFKKHIADTVSIRYGYRMDITTVTVIETDTVSEIESMAADEQRPALAPEEKLLPVKVGFCDAWVFRTRLQEGGDLSAAGVDHGPDVHGRSDWEGPVEGFLRGVYGDGSGPFQVTGMFGVGEHLARGGVEGEEIGVPEALGVDGDEGARTGTVLLGRVAAYVDRDVGETGLGSDFGLPLRLATGGEQEEDRKWNDGVSHDGCSDDGLLLVCRTGSLGKVDLACVVPAVVPVASAGDDGQRCRCGELRRSGGCVSRRHGDGPGAPARDLARGVDRGP